MRLSAETQELGQAFVSGLKAVLGDKLYAVYLYGALAFPEGGSTGDIDCHVIIREALSEQEKAQLHQLHQALARQHPPLPGALLFSLEPGLWAELRDGVPGPRLRHEFRRHSITLSARCSKMTQVRDGRWQVDDQDHHGSYVLLKEGQAINVYCEALDAYYILLDEARQTLRPQHQLAEGVRDDSWALHREHLRAGRCIVLYGPDPREVCPPASWPELASALQGELDYVQQHLGDYPAYCVLNLCRLMYSYQTRDVVTSKRAAAAWAQEAYPQWRPLIRAAIKAYDRQASTQEMELLRSKVQSLFDFAVQRIRESLSKPQQGGQACP